MTDATAPLRYRAFLSYSHRDEAMARRLHRRLESFRVPAGLRAKHDGDIPARLNPVFRDRDELASASALSSGIERALDESAALIVVCSPAAAASPWVGQEIRYFREHYPQRPVLAFVVAGDPGASPHLAGSNAAFPAALLVGDFADPSAPAAEPLAADARGEADGFSAAFLKLVAGLLGVRYDELRQREARRRQQRWSFAIAASLALSATMAWLAWDATQARDVARRAQARAELELESERQTRSFLLSVFELADAERSRGDRVTVREVLDRAVARIDGSSFARPEIKARFRATLGQAYSSLGLYKRSAELLRTSIADDAAQTTPEAQVQREESRIELADVLFNMGEYDAAMEALAPLGAPAAGDLESRLRAARAANVRGDVLAYQERDADANTAYNQAVRYIDGIDGEAAALIRARSLGGLALLRHYAGDYAGADRHHAQVLEALMATVGERHPATISAILSRGSSAYAGGQIDIARTQWERALALGLQIYDENGPEIGTIKNNLGLLRLEAGDLVEAEALLRAALLSDRTHRSDQFDDLAYTLNNLGWTRYFQRDQTEAGALWDEALPIAQAANHPMLGPILTGLATLDCAHDRVAEGRARAGSAVAAAREHHGDEHWRTASAQLSAAVCQARADGAVDRRQVDAAVGLVESRWSAASPFRKFARDQRAALGPGN